MILCVKCASRRVMCSHRSPIRPEEDRFECEECGHKFLRYDEHPRKNYSEIADTLHDVWGLTRDGEWERAFDRLDTIRERDIRDAELYLAVACTRAAVIRSRYATETVEEYIQAATDYLYACKGTIEESRDRAAFAKFLDSLLKKEGEA